MHRRYSNTWIAAAIFSTAVRFSAALAGQAQVDADRLKAAASDAANWMSYGRTYDEQRFSPLTQINASNVRSLGLAWFADLDSNRGQEATPLVVDGVLYTSTAWSMVKAYDAATGRLVWAFDPKVPREIGPDRVAPLLELMLPFIPSNRRSFGRHGS